MSTQSCN